MFCNDLSQTVHLWGGGGGGGGGGMDIKWNSPIGLVKVLNPPTRSTASHMLHN